MLQTDPALFSPNAVEPVRRQCFQRWEDKALDLGCGAVGILICRLIGRERTDKSGKV